MVENVVTIEARATVKKAAELMNKHEIGCLIAVEDKKPVGIVTERDMLNRVIHQSKTPGKTKVCEIMSKSLIVASPTMRAGDAAKLMLERNIKKLPVVENGKLVGLVSLTDLLRSEGVIEFLNRATLNGASKRIRKAVSLYIDPENFQRRRCPMNMKDGFSLGCQDKKCMWWAGDECAITKLSRNIEGLQTESFALETKDSSDVECQEIEERAP
jgi:CBS-domain-containing membrane protein